MQTMISIWIKILTHATHGMENIPVPLWNFKKLVSKSIFICVQGNTLCHGARIVIVEISTAVKKHHTMATLIK